MSVTIKSEHEIELMREAGRLLAIMHEELQKEIKPGTTATFKVTVRPKEIKTKLEALINVVCNDPNGPIRLIKVTAYK